MTKITIDMDDIVAEQLNAVLRAHNLTVEQWLRAEVEDLVRQEHDTEIENPSHRAIMAALERPAGFYASPREEVHDREHMRALAYDAARKELLKLIDSTQGDMGKQKWNRSSLYAP